LKLFGQGKARGGGSRVAGIFQLLRWEVLLLAIAPVILIASPLASAQKQGVSEYQVKAAYLYNFTKAAEWPEQRLPPGAPVLIGIVGGDDEFVETVTKTVSGKTAGTHAIAVRRADTDAEISSCHLIFFRSSAGRKRTESAIAAAGANSRILWVGEDGAFLREGGMINLFLTHGTVRFEVDRASMERVGIRLGAALLALANPGSDSSNSASDESVADAPAPPAAGAARRLKVSTPPEYPDIARKMGIKGAVQVEASVGRDGTVKNVKVIGGHPMLADALAKAVLHWQYEPAAKESQIVVRYVFER
jgi:TonB family protein